MEPKRVHVESFLVSGLCTRTTNEDEMNPETARIPALWEQFWSEGGVAIPEAVSDSPVYGVYDNYESDATGAFDVTAGRRVSVQSDNAELVSVEIESGDYFVFEGKGPMPEIVVQTWGEVWDYFERHPEIIRAYKTDFEEYRDDQTVAIYIGLL